MTTEWLKKNWKKYLLRMKHADERLATYADCESYENAQFSIVDALLFRHESNEEYQGVIYKPDEKNNCHFIGHLRKDGTIWSGNEGPCDVIVGKFVRVKKKRKAVKDGKNG